jgi:hypothetical protein
MRLISLSGGTVSARSGAGLRFSWETAAGAGRLTRNLHTSLRHCRSDIVRGGLGVELPHKAVGRAGGSLSSRPMRSQPQPPRAAVGTRPLQHGHTVLAI